VTKVRPRAGDRDRGSPRTRRPSVGAVVSTFAPSRAALSCPLGDGRARARGRRSAPSGSGSTGATFVAVAGALRFPSRRRRSSRRSGARRPPSTVDPLHERRLDAVSASRRPRASLPGLSPGRQTACCPSCPRTRRTPRPDDQDAHVVLRQQHHLGQVRAVRHEAPARSCLRGVVTPGPARSSAEVVDADVQRLRDVRQRVADEDLVKIHAYVRVDEDVRGTTRDLSCAVVITAGAHCGARGAGAAAQHLPGTDGV